MKIIALSDSHGSHWDIKNIPDGDILVHCGDLSSQGRLPDTLDFLRWFNTHPHKHKIFIAGNHDWIFEQDPNFYRIVKLDFPELTYLQDEGCEVEGIKFYGSPHQPRFYNWAFNKDRGADIKQYWDKIPDDTDVLITHGPPYGICDEAYRVGYNITEHVGCVDLLDAIKRVKPKIWMGGHIHYSYGIGSVTHEDGSKTMCYNCSILDEQYMVANKPWIINI
jgi:Icc-related predicted phosphoesterase